MSNPSATNSDAGTNGPGIEETYTNRDYFDIVGVNGYLLDERYIPEEILTLILSYLDPDDLVFNCRRVCKVWCNVIDRDVLRIKCGRKKYDMQKLNEFPWFVLFWLLKKEFLNRNLVKNGCGQADLAHWDILSSGGDQWAVERPPHGVGEFPKDSVTEEIVKHNSCFITSYYSCSKQQVIDLKAEGAIPYIMKKVHPLITVSEWYCGRTDCRSVYELQVRLRDENEDIINEFEIIKSVGGPLGDEWQQVKYVFDDYTPDVRYVEFFHCGQDSQFWKGHYGSKMTGASVVLSLR